MSVLNAIHKQIDVDSEMGNDIDTYDRSFSLCSMF